LENPEVGFLPVQEEYLPPGVRVLKQIRLMIERQ
jgi:hypothetical protein